jgi:hypothetical protein
LRGLENRVLGRIFGLLGDEITEDWKNLLVEGSMLCALLPALFGRSNYRG